MTCNLASLASKHGVDLESAEDVYRHLVAQRAEYQCLFIDAEMGRFARIKTHYAQQDSDFTPENPTDFGRTWGKHPTGTAAKKAECDPSG